MRYCLASGQIIKSGIALMPGQYLTYCMHVRAPYHIRTEEVVHIIVSVSVQRHPTQHVHNMRRGSVCAPYRTCPPEQAYIEKYLPS